MNNDKKRKPLPPASSNVRPRRFVSDGGGLAEKPGVIRIAQRRNGRPTCPVTPRNWEGFLAQIDNNQPGTISSRPQRMPGGFKTTRFKRQSVEISNNR